MSRSLRSLQALCWEQEIDNFKSYESEPPYYFLTRASGELGELINLLNKRIVYAEEVDQEKIVKEFGDTLYFLLLAASQHKVDLTQALIKVHRVIEDRLKNKYFGKVQND